MSGVEVLVPPSCSAIVSPQEGIAHIALVFLTLVALVDGGLTAFFLAAPGNHSS